MAICLRITCTVGSILWPMDHNTPSSSCSNMSTFIRMVKPTEAIITSTANTHMGLGQAMAGPQAPRGQSGGGFLEPATSAINSERNVMGKLLVLIALVSLRLRSVFSLLMICRIWVGLRIYSGTKEARQGFSQRSGTTSRRCCCQWSKITHRAIIRREDFPCRVTK